MNCNTHPVSLPPVALRYCLPATALLIIAFTAVIPARAQRWEHQSPALAGDSLYYVLTRPGVVKSYHLPSGNPVLPGEEQPHFSQLLPLPDKDAYIGLHPIISGKKSSTYLLGTAMGRDKKVTAEVKSEQVSKNRYSGYIASATVLRYDSSSQQFVNDMELPFLRGIKFRPLNDGNKIYFSHDGGSIYFANSGTLYRARLQPGAVPQPLSPAIAGLMITDLSISGNDKTAMIRYVPAHAADSLTGQTFMTEEAVVRGLDVATGKFIPELNLH